MHRTSVPDGTLHVAAAVIRDASGAVLLTLRPEHAHQGGLWEFPGGKVEPGEDVLTALRRELDEELGIACLAARPLIALHHAYADRQIWLDVWCVERWQGTPAGREGQALRWVAADALAGVRMPAADVPVVSAIRLPAVYLVTPDPGAEQTDFLDRLSECLLSGVTLVQLRTKSMAGERYAELAAEVVKLVHGHGARVLLNSEPELAQRLHADGVQLTSARLHQLAQRPLPKGLWVGASCHNAQDLMQARRIDADFAVLGPVGRTHSHTHAEPIGWENFQTMARAVCMPVYAIGGMRLEDLPAAWSAGAQGIASISAIWFA